MTPRSLVRRLTLAFAVLAGACVVATGLAVSAFLESAVWDRLDAAFEEEAELLAHTAATAPGELAALAAAIAAETDHGRGKSVRVVDAEGRVVAAGAAPPAGGPKPPLPRATVWTGGAPHRVIHFARPGGGLVEIGVPASEQVGLLRRARTATGAGLAGLLVAVVLLARSVAARATRELARVAAELETIEAGSLDRRLTPRRTVEVDRLVAVLNRLLARLEVAVGHLRRFTADAAHELRTPIAALRAHLEVTLARDGPADTYREGLLDALEQAERLGTLAESLLALSAIEATAVPADPGPVALDAVVQEVVEALEPVAQEQGRALLARIAAPVGVRGSAALLRRVVLNLVDNAFRHTPPGTPVEVALWREDGRARLAVRDAGPGIPLAEQERAFQRFHRGPGGGGAGLGLALCREIVARHGGEITLESVPGTGTTVQVTLPAV